MVVVDCPNCLVPFSTTNAISGRQYCSTACRVEFQVARRKCTCDQCGIEFLAPGKSDVPDRRFCSRECGFESYRVDVTCSVCASVFRLARTRVKKKRNVCQECE